MEARKFVELLKPYALKVQERTGLPWQAMVAQAALETGWLRYPTKDSVTKRDSMNLFNIKHTGKGDFVTCVTHEFVNGRRIRTEARFRAYASYEEAFADYAAFIRKYKRYAKALEVKADPVGYVQELERAGYTTDPMYAEKLVSIMRKYMGV